MRSGIFGWSYPPGAANDPNAPYNQTDDGPCEMCGQRLDDCVCPECPVCGCYGDPACYGGMVKCSWCGIRTPEQIDSCWRREAGGCHAGLAQHEPLAGHGLVRSFAQVALLADAEARWAEQERQEAIAEEELSALWRNSEEYDR